MEWNLLKISVRQAVSQVKDGSYEVQLFKTDWPMKFCQFATILGIVILIIIINNNY